MIWTFKVLLCSGAYPIHQNWREMQNWSGKLSGSGLRLACVCLGIKRPVKIQVGLGSEVARIPGNTPRKGTRAFYEPKKDAAGDLTHLIRVSRYCDNDEANEAIIHELAHAAQNETYGLELAQRIYSACDALLGYKNNPLEAEARRWAGLHESVKVVMPG